MRMWLVQVTTVVLALGAPISGTFAAAQRAQPTSAGVLRLTAIPQLLDFAEDAALDDQTQSWVFQALRDITGQTLPRQASLWRDWYVRFLRR